MIREHFKKYFNGIWLWGTGVVLILGLLWIGFLIETLPYKVIGGLIWTALVYASVIDIKTQLINDAVSYSIGIFGAVYCLVTWQSPWHWGLGVGTNILIMMSLYIASKKAMGLGDVKLMIALGLFLGPLRSFYVLFYASLVGAVIAIVGLVTKKLERRQEVPFIPYIALGFLLALSSVLR